MSRFVLSPLESLPLIPWKNGRGLTRTLAVSPPGAGLEDFDWRLSLADIQPGELDFSRFPGIDRHTMVLGPGLSWAPAGSPPAAFQPVPPLTPQPLEGETALLARLEGQAVQALNLMLRRGRARGTIAACTGVARLPAARTLLVVCLEGHAQVRAAGQHIELPAQCLLSVDDAGSTGAELEAMAADTLVLVAAVDRAPSHQALTRRWPGAG